ncbi:RNA pseudouridylate synthase domain-containing 2 [Paramuricea clavata]|uniref:Pseudouridylate synthase RPUSD2 n=1 Tax=Paramuricea clavata TaxID=317549 RepID=A0A6S7GV36_PARCT|nr:RNA pseudouridylate synthase domain-containing 2 [Paramuricea clavata]
MADDLNAKKRKKEENLEKNPKRRKTVSRKKPGFDKDIFKETEYYVKDGLRYVKPYPFTFTTYCKGRWLRRKLIDVLSQEFQSETTEYYRKAIENGNITVNGAQTKEDVILKDNDIISHKVHRHEPPVTAEPIQIISETEDVVVVNKPPSIPIHPCGRYRHNTLVFLLGREFGLTNLYTIHRIDRLTSGIVMFAKSLKKAQELEKQLRGHELQKEYVCRVQGEFPSEEIDCNEPIAVVSHKVGVCRVHKDGKLCRTVFTRESFDGTSSIVKCQPYTGRMHQIRVHLQWLGYPIVDDPIYNHDSWGLDRGKGGVDEDKAWKVIESIATSLRKNDAGLHSQSNSQRSPTSSKGKTTETTLSSLDCGTKLRKSESLENETNTCDELKLVTMSELSSIETRQEKGVVIQTDMKDDELKTASYKGRTTTSVGNCDTCDELKLVTMSELSSIETRQEKGVVIQTDMKDDELKTASYKGRTTTSVGNCDTCDELKLVTMSELSSSETRQEKGVVIQTDMKGDELKTASYKGRTTTSVENCDTCDEKVSAVKKEEGTNTENEVKDKTNIENSCRGMSCGNEDVVDEIHPSGEKKVPGCTECRIHRRDPTPAELTMCLHAAVYKGPDWEFRCPWPAWALSNMDSQTTD